MLNLQGKERVMGADDIIVSKTNLKGHITYANDVFLDIADFTRREVLNKPHSLVRNPEMPRCVFKLLWEQVQSGREIFAYVVNNTKHGDYYWVLAHVTPSMDAEGNVTGYHSNRRKPDPRALEQIQQLYGELLKEERRHSNRKEGLKASYDLLMRTLELKGMSYDEFVLSF